MTTRRLNLKRYRKIIKVFTKHGFGLLVEKYGIFEYLKIRKKPVQTDIAPGQFSLSAGIRLRMALEELGPTFVKLGQMLSTRPDMFPPDMIQELKKLQEATAPFSFQEAKKVIETEFGDKLENIFDSFDEIPVAAASVSQVHRGRLKSGVKTAVKVQRPQIREIIDLDLAILRDLASLIDHRTQFGEFYNTGEMVQVFETTIREELDFTREADHAETFKENFRNDAGITVPQVKWIYTTSRVLTMTYVDGMKINDLEELTRSGVDHKEVALNLASSLINQIFRDGFFHADPHPGNLRVLADGTIVFLDLGMVGRLDEARKHMISNFFIGVATKDSGKIVRSLLDMDIMSKRSHIKQLERDINQLIDKYLLMPVHEIRIQDLFHETFRISYAYKIRLPREFTVLAKTLGTLQGILEDLDPELNALVVARPIAQKLMVKSFSYDQFTMALKKSGRDYRDLLVALPSTITHFLGRIEDEDFIFRLELKDADQITKTINRGVNRVSFSIVLLSVCIIIAGIIIGSGLSTGASPELLRFNARILRVGLLIAAIILSGLMISVIRSNRS